MAEVGRERRADSARREHLDLLRRHRGAGRPRHARGRGRRERVERGQAAGRPAGRGHGRGLPGPQVPGACCARSSPRPTARRATVQVKVTILDKDQDLKPEMSARVTFLDGRAARRAGTGAGRARRDGAPGGRGRARRPAGRVRGRATARAPAGDRDGPGAQRGDRRQGGARRRRDTGGAPRPRRCATAITVKDAHGADERDTKASCAIGRPCADVRKVYTRDSRADHRARRRSACRCPRASSWP